MVLLQILAIDGNGIIFLWKTDLLNGSGACCLILGELLSFQLPIWLDGPVGGGWCGREGEERIRCCRRGEAKNLSTNQINSSPAVNSHRSAIFLLFCWHHWEGAPFPLLVVLPSIWPLPGFGHWLQLQGLELLVPLAGDAAVPAALPFAAVPPWPWPTAGVAATGSAAWPTGRRAPLGRGHPAAVLAVATSAAWKTAIAPMRRATMVACRGKGHWVGKGAAEQAQLRCHCHSVVGGGPVAATF